MIYFVVGCCLSIAFGVRNEVLERRYPTPSEWSFFSAYYFHEAEEQKDPEMQRDGFVDNGASGDGHNRVVKRLEDPSIDGADIKEQSEADRLTAPGQGPTGYDVSAKSEPWRRNYFICLMAVASAAEYMEGWLLDTKRHVYAPPEFVKGPSNPRPRPLPKGAPIPQEKDCVPAFDPPEHYYHKIMTTKGLSNSQQIEAALAYSVYLDYKNRHQDARDAINWAMDLSCKALDEPSAVVNKSSGVINANAQPTENVLRTSTALAIHEASTGNVNKALPIFLSVLRARNDAPTASMPISSKPSNPSISEQLRILFSNSFPSPPRSGDEPAMQDPTNPCEAASLKTYIGEILFARSRSHRETGLNWTREAAEEAQLGFRNTTVERAIRSKCSQCADVAMNNWKNMTALLAEEERQQRSAQKNSGWRQWVGYKAADEEQDEELGRWEAENMEVSRRARDLKVDMMKYQLGRT
jgi:hypothetical protein